MNDPWNETVFTVNTPDVMICQKQLHILLIFKQTVKSYLYRYTLESVGH